MKTINQGVEKPLKHVKRRLKFTQKRIVKSGLIIVNMLLLVGITGFVFVYKPTPDNSVKNNSVSAGDIQNVNPLDKVSSADIAVSLAQLARLDEITAVANNADTVNSQLEIVPADTQIVAKPQIVSTASKSISDLATYVTVDGDTVTSLAERFGVSTETIKWSNSLSGDNIAVNTTLVIPPVNGVVYTVKSGEAVKDIASKYKAEESRIIAFNDIEITGLVAGEKIVIPDGKVPAPVVRSVPTFSGFRFGSSAIYGYNGYDYGYCTWYAANRRAEIGKPVPANLGNASTWKVIAQRAGIPVGSTPQAGAVIWTPPRDYYGHVGFVEEVFADGSVRISEMNVSGWGVRSEKVLTPAQAAAYNYIY